MCAFVLSKLQRAQCDDLSLFLHHSCRQQSLSPDDDALTLDKCEEIFNTLQQDYYEEFKVNEMKDPCYFSILFFSFLCAKPFRVTMEIILAFQTKSQVVFFFVVVDV